MLMAKTYRPAERWAEQTERQQRNRKSERVNDVKR